MAANKIKGLTVEIGGDTTKLGKALEDVNKKSKDLSSELGQINKLLKLDPGNAELLTQKQKVLAEAVANTSEKLKTLKEAEKQVQAQFKKGEVSEEQVRALQREIVETTNKLKSYERAANETAEEIKDLGKQSKNAKDDTKDLEKGSDKASDSLDDMAESADKAGDASDGLGSKLGGLVKGGLAALAAGVTAVIGAMVGSAEATREYRREMGKLDTAFTTNGHSSEAALQTYQTLQGILGETDQAVEAANHLAKLTENAEDLAKWTDVATGVYATFGSSLPIENLTEAANETAKVGQVTGPLADALNWAGVSEDAFNESLAACSSEQERQTLIMETLSGLYTDAADKYKETNAEVIRANQANEEWASIMAEVGGTVEPILTDVKLLGASLLGDLVPGVQQMTESFRGMMMGDGVVDYLSELTGMSTESIEELRKLGETAGYNSAEFQELANILAEGDDGMRSSLTNILSGSTGVGSALSGIFEHLLSTVTNMLPQMADMAVSLITTLTTSLIGMIPQLATVGVQIITSMLSGISTAIPQIVSTVVKMIPELVEAIQKGLPLILQGMVTAVTALVTMLSEQLPVILPLVLDTILSLVDLLVGQLPILLPQILNLIVSLVTMLVNQLPILIPQIVSLVVQVIELLAEQLPLLVPQLVTALVSIVTLLTEQLPVIIPMLIEACITIVLALIEALPDILVALTEALPEILQAVWDAIVMIFENLPAWFGQIFDGAVEIIKAIFGALGDWFASIWDTICEIFAPVGEWFGNIFSSAWSGIKSAWSSVSNFFSGIWTGIKNVFSSVGTWFKDIFNKAWTGIKNVFSNVKSFFTGIWDTIKNAFSSIGTKISDAISGAVKSGINGLLGSAEKIINGFLRMINGAIGLINEIPGVSISKVDLVSFTRLAKGGVVNKATPAIFGEDGAEAVVPLEKNTEWIQRVAREFMAQVRNEAGASILGSTTNKSTEPVAGNGMLDKLDKILSAIERGQILTIDGKTWVGATADMTDSALGQRRALAARGAV